jgi:hypothetical protein
MSLHRITAPLALGLVLSVVAAPTAFAEQDLRSPDTRDAAAAAAERYTDLRNPDTRDLPKNGAHPELTVVEVPVSVPAADSASTGATRALAPAPCSA